MYEEQDLRKAELIQKNGFMIEIDAIELAERIYYKRVNSDPNDNLPIPHSQHQQP